MATVLDRADSGVVAWLRAKREFGNRRHVMGGAVMGASGGAAVVDYIRVRDLWCGSDPPDSVRDAQAFLEIRLCVCGCHRVKQQYRGLTTRFEHGLAGRANQKAVGAR